MSLRPLALAAALALIAAPAWSADPDPLAKGQTVYVPVYSHIVHGNLDPQGKPQELLLSSMLSIRNTDPGAGLVIKSVRYYDTGGKQLREYAAQPKPLPPLASTEVFIEHKDAEGGSGANFLVEWEAERPINPPVIEVVNAYFFGPHSLAFTSNGRPIAVGK